MRRSKTASHISGLPDGNEMSMKNMTVNEAYKTVDPRYYSGPPGTEDSIIYEEPTV